jgi:hypothetical protein
MMLGIAGKQTGTTEVLVVSPLVTSRNSDSLALIASQLLSPNCSSYVIERIRIANPTYPTVSESWQTALISRGALPPYRPSLGEIFLLRLDGVAQLWCSFRNRRAPATWNPKVYPSPPVHCDFSKHLLCLTHKPNDDNSLENSFTQKSPIWKRSRISWPPCRRMAPSSPSSSFHQRHKRLATRSLPRLCDTLTGI